ncbi:MAG: hypothetical protein BRC53_01510, partial [Cyanobacteria bacterium SW_6_48_11]
VVLMVPSRFSFSIPSAVVLLLMIATLENAILDERDRGTFSDWAHMGLGGYFGQLFPRRRD